MYHIFQKMYTNHHFKYWYSPYDDEMLIQRKMSNILLVNILNTDDIFIDSVLTIICERYTIHCLLSFEYVTCDFIYTCEYNIYVYMCGYI